MTTATVATYYRTASTMHDALQDYIARHPDASYADRERFCLLTLEARNDGLLQAIFIEVEEPHYRGPVLYYREATR